MACKPLVLFPSVAPAHVYCRSRWVDCQLGYLRCCLPGRIRRALEELPDTLDGTYERALRDLGKANWEFAYRLLQFVAVATRPLLVEELVQFLGFDFTTGPVPIFQQDWLPEDPVHAILSTTSSLLTTFDLDGSQVIQFSHFSVKEFLTSSRLAEASDIFVQRYHISMTEAHTLATQACLGMLLHLDKDITIDGLDKFPLAEYAAEHWVDHARFEDVSFKAEDGMKRLFDPNRFHFAIWVWIHDLEDRYWRREKRREWPSSPRGTPLHYASLCGLDAIVKFLVIDHSQDVDSRGFDDESTALHLASKKGYVEVARFLLDNGANANARDKGKSTPLHEASIGGHAEVVRALVERGVDVTAENDDENNPVVLAFFLGRVEVMKVFLELDMSGAVDDIKRWPPLLRALYDGRTEEARVLLERGAHTTHVLGTGLTPLHVATLGGHAAAIRVLLEHGFDVTAKDDMMGSALNLASFGGHVEVARLLLEHGADVASQSFEGLTSLHAVALTGSVDIARLLLERGANVTARDKDAKTPLHTVAEDGHVELARLLLDYGADTTAQDNDGKTPLHTAAAKGDVQLARLLLDCGADTTTQSYYGQTPLHVAEANGHVEFTRLLLERGTDATAQADDRRVPIHITVNNKYVEPPQLLPDGGTDGTAKSEKEWAPLRVAAAEGNPKLESQLPERDTFRTPTEVVTAEGLVEFLGLLPSPGIDATDQADDGRTSNQVSVSGGYVEPASLRPEPRAVLTAQASNELTPSNVTAAEGHVGNTRSLCQPGPDAATHADDGQTLLRMAAQREHEDAGCILPDHGKETMGHDDQRWCRCIVQ